MIVLHFALGQSLPPARSSHQSWRSAREQLNPLIGEKFRPCLKTGKLRDRIEATGETVLGNFSVQIYRNKNTSG
jgi:hypothetical protein